MAQYLALPAQESERRLEAIKLLSLGLLAAAIMGAIGVFVMWLVDRSNPILTYTILATVVALISQSSYWLARTGHTGLAGYVFVNGFLMMIPVITILLGGITGPLAILYIFPIIVSGIVLGINHGFFIATLASILYLVMIPVEQIDLIPQIFGAGARGIPGSDDGRRAHGRVPDVGRGPRPSAGE